MDGIGTSSPMKRREPQPPGQQGGVSARLAGTAAVVERKRSRRVEQRLMEITVGQPGYLVERDPELVNPSRRSREITTGILAGYYR
jgi:hypothetical protein